MRSVLLALATLLALGRPVLAEPPERIVSIGGAVTEILYALGEEGRIAAVDTTSLFPPQALAEKPDVGYMRALSAEGVLSLRPDLILMEDGAGPPDAVALIDGAGVAVRHVPSGWTVPDLLRKVRDVAGAVGRGSEGESMARRIESELAALERDTASIKERRRVLFILSLADGQARAAGRNTGADAVIRMAGGVNVFAEADGYKTLSPEAAAALAPDAILMLDRAGPGGGDPLAIPALRATPAGRSGAVIRMDGNYLLGFGPRLPAALRELFARLYHDRAAPTAAAAADAR